MAECLPGCGLISVTACAASSLMCLLPLKSGLNIRFKLILIRSFKQRAALDHWFRHGKSKKSPNIFEKDVRASVPWMNYNGVILLGYVTNLYSRAHANFVFNVTTYCKYRVNCFYGWY